MTLIILDIENIISRIKEDEAAQLSKMELQYILAQLKEYQALQERYRILKNKPPN